MPDYRHYGSKAVKSAKGGTPEYRELENDPEWQKLPAPPEAEDVPHDPTVPATPVPTGTVMVQETPTPRSKS